MNEQQPFSIRHGHKQPKPIQLESMDEDLRNGLWNVFYSCFPNPKNTSIYKRLNFCFELIWKNFLKNSADEYRGQGIDENKIFVKNIFLFSPWHEVFDLIEFAISYLHNTSTNQQIRAKLNFIYLCNEVLSKENSAYQIVGDLVVEITSEEEIASIEQAMDVPFAGVREHIRQSLVLLSRRENPDYPNSMKESISALEALAREITGDPRGTLGKLKDRLPIEHPAFKAAIGKLYGFSSDAGGIRHGSDGEPLPMDKSTARFVLIICSAFVNYIVSSDSSRN